MVLSLRTEPKDVYETGLNPALGHQRIRHIPCLKAIK